MVGRCRLRTCLLDSWPILGAIAGAFMLAGLIKGVIGLGLPTVAIGLLGLLMSPAQAAAILVLPALITNIWQFVVGGELLALVRRMWPMLAGICIGTFIGAVVLPRDNAGQATVWLGSALVLYAALGLIKIRFEVPRRAEVWLGLLMGTATGAITVATGIFVLPGTPYVQALQFERDRMVQALGLSFTVSTVTLAAALGYAGEIHTSLLGPALVALAASLIGMWLGQLVRGRIRAGTFRLCFFVGLLLLGAHLALRGLT
ncbi:MAG: sulfite exporter TauE/SafE family protein [Rhizobiales bacterium]|nr:sulfite exporter TauE/SafE family protein [Hyphomicrobiales bacterium]